MCKLRRTPLLLSLCPQPPGSFSAGHGILWQWIYSETSWWEILVFSLQRWASSPFESFETPLIVWYMVPFHMLFLPVMCFLGGVPGNEGDSDSWYWLSVGCSWCLCHPHAMLSRFFTEMIFFIFTVVLWGSLSYHPLFYRAWNWGSERGWSTWPKHTELVRIRTGLNTKV